MTNHSYSILYYHLVWATEDRNPFISKKFKEQLYAYIGKIALYKDFCILAVGGVEDHIHVLIQATAKNYIPKIVSNIKSNSSRYIRECFLTEFSWQVGYSIFTVDALSLPRIKKYILNQETHHAKMTYQRESDLLFQRCVVNAKIEV